MNLNPQFLDIGQSFAKQYYAQFDASAESRSTLGCFYHAEHSLMSFEGVQVQGSQAILEKIKGFTFKTIRRGITAVDCQPTFDGGVIVNVLGQLQMDEDPAHGFTQTFVLKPANGSFFIQHDMFRLVIHNV